MVLFDEIFGGFEGILLEIALRFEVLHVLSFLDGFGDRFLEELFFNGL